MEQTRNDAAPLDGAALLALAARWRREGRAVALAMVVGTWGSSPRPVGSLLAVDQDGHMLGSVSGGCVEGAVVAAAAAVMANGVAQTLEFGVSDGAAQDVGLACGGRIRVLLLPLEHTPRGDAGGMSLGTIDAIAAALSRNRPLVLATRLADGAQRILETRPQSAAVAGPETAQPGHAALTRAARQALAADRSQAVEIEDTHWLIQVFNTPLRLLVVGAVHIAQVLLPMARLAGYGVTLIDPRTAFATEERFPQTELVHAWPQRAFAQLMPDSRTAVVSLSHDAKLDDPALLAALDSQAFYIGALGSRRTHADRLERLAGAGIEPAGLARIHGPVGLDIGALSPAEIALSIVAEMTRCLRRPQPPGP